MVLLDDTNRSPSPDRKPDLEVTIHGTRYELPYDRTDVRTVDTSKKDEDKDKDK